MKNVIVFIIFSLVSVNSFSQDDFCETLVTEGKAQISMAPEIVNFNINFTVKDSSFVKCSEMALLKIKKIKQQFMNSNVDTSLIKTISYYVRENLEYDERTRKRVFAGYSATIPVSITTQLNNSESNKIFEIVKNNFKSNLNISFRLSEDQIDKIKDELIGLAVQDATMKAKALTKSLKVELGKVNKIQYGDPKKIRNFTHSNYDLISSMQLQSSTSKVNFNTLTPADVIMSTSVMLAWEIKY